MGSRVRPQQWQPVDLVALGHALCSLTKDQTHVPCIGRQILTQCTTRELPFILMKANVLMVCAFCVSKMLVFNFSLKNSYGCQAVELDHSEDWCTKAACAFTPS